MRYTRGIVLKGAFLAQKIKFPARALILYRVNNVVTYREIPRTGRETTEIGQSRFVTTELH